MSEVTIVGWIPIQQGVTWPAAQIKVSDTVLTVHYDIEDAQVVIKQVSGDKLTSKVVRSANLTGVARHLTKVLREHPERLSMTALDYVHSKEGKFGITWDSEEERLLAKAIYESTWKETRPRRGAGAQNPDFYRQVAIDYLATIEWAGQRVIEQMTRAYRLRPEHLDLSKNTVKTWVSRARQTGWLTKGTRGKAGAKPGPKLKQWLREQGDES